MSHPIISADSHVTEPPNTYIDHIDPAFRDRAPRLHHINGAGDVFLIDGMKTPVPMGIVAAAGKPAEQIRIMGTRFEELHRGGWDPEARLADQDRDGVAAEVIYPTVGMVICNHRDADYKKACFDAYNRWLAVYCAPHPTRLLGVGQTAMRSPGEGIRDLEAIRDHGLRGVMMPGNPVVDDYDSTAYDEFWEAAIALDLPLSFHILTTRETTPVRGPKMNAFLGVIRGCQDIMGTLVLGGVFERHPKLRVVCVEADAGWVPHYMYRMDHAWKRHRNWLPAGQALSKLPSEYFAASIYTTFQDDWVAFRSVDMLNWRRLMWANDFPHSDSTWPDSQAMLAEHAAALTPEQRRAILCDNVADLYHIDLAALS
ncbi:MAG TPA: amidohydrolase family protein [Candidatus Binatia bacterium]|jgi:predicted TIM-barrel fold metal-dependent hydrolase|nr:amidohydrolase family protein [Candidatus Binatia bacterium]